jgi:hypothetical protein
MKKGPTMKILPLLLISTVVACTAPIPLTQEQHATLVDGQCYQVDGLVFIPVPCDCEINEPYVVDLSDPWYCGWSCPVGSNCEGSECPEGTTCADRVITTFEAAVCVNEDGEIISHPPPPEPEPEPEPDPEPDPEPEPECELDEDCEPAWGCWQGYCVPEEYLPWG